MKRTLKIFITFLILNKDKLSINGADVQKDRNATKKRQKAEIAKKR